jgi:hypothetical protein
MALVFLGEAQLRFLKIESKLSTRESALEWVLELSSDTDVRPGAHFESDAVQAG